MLASRAQDAYLRTMNITGTSTSASAPPIRDGFVRDGFVRDGFVRETFRLPRAQARAAARAWLDRWPRAAYWSEVEAWRVHDGDGAATGDDTIEFTMRRLPTAD